MSRNVSDAASGPVTPEPTDPVDRLLFECIGRPEPEWPAAIDAACQARPDLAPALRARLAALRSIGRLAPAGDEATTQGVRLGRFRLLRRLGAGGMGVVWLAEQTDLGRRVALKLVRPELLGSASAKARFAREALAATRLDHPAICPVYEVGESDGTPYIVMRYLEGETLAERIARRDGEPGHTPAALRRQEVDEILQQFERLAAGLQAAHDHRLVHRDIKPANIFLTAQGEAVILDFGLARDLGSQGQTLTATGDQLGTPAYMPPEQIRGDSSEVDHRADVYALGVSLFEALTGQRPFESANRELLYQQILREPPLDVLRLRPGLPPELRPVLEKALEKRPADRFATIGELGEELRRIRQRQPVVVRGIGPWLRVRRWAQRNPGAATTLGLLSLGLAAALVVVRVLLEQRQQLRVQTRRAATIALANEAMATVAVDPRAALPLAVRACESEPGSSAALSALHSALAQQHELLAIEAPEAAEVLWSPADPDLFASRHIMGRAFVWNLARRPVAKTELTGHRDGKDIEGLAFAPDGQQVATSCEDGFVRVFRTADGVLRWTSPDSAPGFVPYGIAFAPDGAGQEPRLAAAYSKQEPGKPPSVHFRLWDRRGGCRVSPPAIDAARGGLFSPTCTFLDAQTLVCCTSSAAFLWHLSDDRVVPIQTRRPTPADPAWLRGVQTGGGTTLLAFGRHGYASIHAADGRLLHRIGAHLPKTEVRSGAVSPDGKLVVTGGYDGRALLTEVATGVSVELRGHAARLQHVTFSPDSSLVLTATSRGVLRLFDRRGDLVLRLDGHRAAARSAQLARDGRRILSAGLDDTLRLWSVAPRGLPVLRGHDQEVVHVAYAGDGSLLATASLDGSVRGWSPSGKPVGPPATIGGAATRIAFEPRRSDRLAAVGGRSIYLVELGRGNATPIVQSTGRALDHFFRDVAWSADGQRLYTFEGRNSGRNAAVRVWQRGPDDAWTQGGKALDLEQCHAFALLPGEGEVLIGCYDGKARIYDLATGAVRAEFEHGDELSRVGCSPDGTLLFTLSRVASDVVKVWRRSGGPPVELRGHRQQPTDAQFDPAGTRLATCAPDGTVRVWSLAGEETFRVEAHDAIVHAVAWSPDGKVLATAASDRTARLWHADPAALLTAAREILANGR